MCSVLAQAFSQSSLVQERVLIGGGRGSGERWRYERVWSHTPYFIFILFYIMRGGQRIYQPCEGKNRVKQRCFTLSLTSVRYSCAPGIHFTAKHRPYSLQIEWVASKWNEVERLDALIKNLSGSCIGPTDFAENIWEDVIMAFLPV